MMLTIASLAAAMFAATAQAARGILVALAASLMLCVAAAPADAYTFGGSKRWPGKPTARIGYYNAAPQWKDAARSAIRAWNASGARVKFVATSKRRARLEIRYMAGGVQELAHGKANVGFNKARRANKRGKPGNLVWLPRLRAPYAALHARELEIIAAHELGHVIGLHHEDRRCSLMGSMGRHPGCTPRPDDRYQRCQLLTPDDVAGAVRRYGGRSKLRGPEFCLIRMSSPTLLGTCFDPAAVGIKQNSGPRSLLRPPTSRTCACAIPTAAGSSTSIGRSAAPTAPVRPRRTRQLGTTRRPGTSSRSGWADSPEAGIACVSGRATAGVA
jgi:hypothetical protein